MENARVGLVGFGTVGRELAVHLMKAHGRLGVVERDAGRAAGIAALGAKALATPAALARECGTVILSLPDPAAVRAVLEGEEGILAAAAGGLLVIDTTTSDPATATEMERLARGRGITYTEAPISTPCPGLTGPETVKQGAGTFLVGAEEADFPRVEAILAPMARHVFHIGRVGQGSAMKLVTNYVAGATRVALAEGIAVAAAMGIPAGRTMEVCRHAAAASQTLEEAIARLLGDDPDHVGFSIELRHKDFRLANELARQVGVPMPLGAQIVELYQMMLARGWGGRDINSIVAFVSGLAGLDPFQPEDRWKGPKG